MKILNVKFVTAAILALGGIVGTDASARSLEMPAIVGEGKASIHAVHMSHMVLNLQGEAAEKLFESLDVQTEGFFGLVQGSRKTLENVTCQVAYLGDTPPQMEGPKYSCRILLRVKN